MRILRPERPVHSRRAISALIVGLTIVVGLALLAVSGCGSSGGGTTTTLAGGGSTGTTTASGNQVTIKNFAFSPASMTIKVGESVTWTNQDSPTHSIAADKGEFKSGDMTTGATYSFKFDKAGTYPYHCIIHPSMTGTIVVQ